MKQNDSSKVRPPYIAWETLKTYLRTLKDSAVPNRIEASMMPPAMSGFSKAGVTSTLKFFSLTDSNGETTRNLKEIVNACDTEKWADTVQKILIPAYDDIIGELKIESAIRKELEEKFGDTTNAMKSRFIRFLLPLMEDAGKQISPYLTQRQNKPRKKRAKITKKKRDNTQQQHPDRQSTPYQDSTPDGMFDQLVPIAGVKEKCFIRFPQNITQKQFEMVKAAVAFIEAMAKQNEVSK